MKGGEGVCHFLTNDLRWRRSKNNQNTLTSPPLFIIIVTCLLLLLSVMVKRKAYGGGSYFQSGNPHKAPAAYGSRSKTSMPYSKAPSQDVRLAGRHFIGDIATQGLLGAFEVASFKINPGNKKLFPWLHRIALQFESYIFHSLKLEFVPFNSTQSPGTVMLCVDFDSRDSAPTSKQQMLQNVDAVQGSVFRYLAYNARKSDLRKRQTNYVRAYSAGTETQARSAQDNIGTALVAFSRTDQDTGGELWISYDVELKTPQPNTADAVTYFQSRQTISGEGDVDYVTTAVWVAEKRNRNDVAGSGVGQPGLNATKKLNVGVADSSPAWEAHRQELISLGRLRATTAPEIEYLMDAVEVEVPGVYEITFFYSAEYLYKPNPIVFISDDVEIIPTDFGSTLTHKDTLLHQATQSVFATARFEVTTGGALIQVGFRSSDANCGTYDEAICGIDVVSIPTLNLNQYLPEVGPDGLNAATKGVAVGEDGGENLAWGAGTIGAPFTGTPDIYVIEPDSSGSVATGVVARSTNANDIQFKEAGHYLMKIGLDVDGADANAISDFIASVGSSGGFDAASSSLGLTSQLLSAATNGAQALFEFAITAPDAAMVWAGDFIAGAGDLLSTTVAETLMEVVMIGAIALEEHDLSDADRRQMHLVPIPAGDNSNSFYGVKNRIIHTAAQFGWAKDMSATYTRIGTGVSHTELPWEEPGYVYA